MTISPNVLGFRYSGGSGNASPVASLGGAMSSADVPSNVDGNYFDTVASAEAQAGMTDFRAYFVRNGDGTLSWLNVKLWFDNLPASPSLAVDMGLDTTSGKGGVNQDVQGPVATEITVPTNVVFTRPVSKVAGLAIGTLPAGGYRGFWLRRVVSTGAGVADDGFSTRAEGDSS